jgi:hypothetical protein
LKAPASFLPPQSYCRNTNPLRRSTRATSCGGRPWHEGIRKDSLEVIAIVGALSLLACLVRLVSRPERPD